MDNHYITIIVPASQPFQIIFDFNILKGSSTDVQCLFLPFSSFLLLLLSIPTLSNQVTPCFPHGHLLSPPQSRKAEKLSIDQHYPVLQIIATPPPPLAMFLFSLFLLHVPFLTYSHSLIRTLHLQNFSIRVKANTI
jgi:hypothetical protein